MFFTDGGKVFSLKVFNLPETSRTSMGRNIVNLLPISKNEKVVEIIPVPEVNEGKYLIIATARGYVKKTPLSDYKNIKQSGIRGIKIEEGDSIVSVSRFRWAKGSDSLCFFWKND